MASLSRNSASCMYFYGIGMWCVDVIIYIYICICLHLNIWSEYNPKNLSPARCIVVLTIFPGFYGYVLLVMFPSRCRDSLDTLQKHLDEILEWTPSKTVQTLKTSLKIFVLLWGLLVHGLQYIPIYEVWYKPKSSSTYWRCWNRSGILCCILV